MREPFPARRDPDPFAARLLRFALGRVRERYGRLRYTRVLPESFPRISQN
jgi:hypothetical protein